MADPAVPSIARVYDACLGGKDNFEADRAIVRELLERDPGALITARDNREWLIRITRFLAGTAGVRQFLDCGAGLPTAENTHEVAQRLNHDAVVIYVDNDPVVAAYGRALLAKNERTHLVEADLTRPSELLEQDCVRRHLNFAEPIALYQVGTLHHFPDPVEVQEIMQIYIEALPSGSYVGLSHFHNPGGSDREMAEETERLFVQGGLGSGYFRDRSEIEAYFCGLPLIDPGLVHPAQWWPDGPLREQLLPRQRMMLAGLARKP